MEMMDAILVPEPGGPERLVIGRFPRPVPARDELLVRVYATALNRADLLQRAGKYPPPDGAGPLLGLEVAGIVAECGASCEGWSVGDRVFGLLSGGGYAAYAVLRADVAMRVPPALTLMEAAAVPEAFLTAYQAIFQYGKVMSGDNVLVHAGASGVGTAAIQLAREAGARVFATASKAKHPACTALGARSIDYRSEQFDEIVLSETGGRGADVIVDFIGAPYFEPNVRALALDGRMILLATMGGSRLSAFDLRPFFRKRGSLLASTLRNRSHAYKARLTSEFAAFALPLLEERRVYPVIDSVFEWTRVSEAHQRMENHENVGKIVLRLAAESS